MRKLNKKGSEKLFSGWWFLILIIVFSVLSYGLVIFYSSDLDVRSIEAQVLSDRIYNCLNDNFKILSEPNSEDLLSLCGINAEVFGQNSDYYLEVYYLDKKFVYGDKSFKKDCEISMGRFQDPDFGDRIKADKYVSCVYDSRVIVDKSGKLINLNILAGSNHVGGSNEK